MPSLPLLFSFAALGACSFQPAGLRPPARGGGGLSVVAPFEHKEEQTAKLHAAPKRKRGGGPSGGTFAVVE